MKEPRMAQAGEEGRQLPSLTPGDVFAARYRVESLLGQGLYGQTYQVKHLKYGQPLVLKVFYPGLFRDDASRQASRAEFDRIRQIKDLGLVRHNEQGDWQEAGTRYVVTEYLPGSTLRGLIDELKKVGRQFAAQDAVQIVVKLLETLKQAHAAGVSHRNLKPENILIVTRGKAAEKVAWDVRISDFALSQAPVDWMTDVSAGKLPFMAPEQQGYGGQVGVRTDVYAVGAMLYEMLTGTAPDGSMTPATKLRPSLPKKLDDILDLCLASNPADRYASVTDLLMELKDLPAILPADENDTPKSRVAPLLVLLGLSSLLAVVFFIFTREPEIPPEASGPALWKQLRDSVHSDPSYIKDSPDQIAEKQKAAPKGMVYVPAGSFIRGAMKGEANVGLSEPPATIVEMPGYYIDMYEFPNKAGAIPQTGLTWDDAEKACNKVGRRLCTSEEWERACKGDNYLIYSYGDEYNATQCPPIGKTGVLAAGAYAECKSSYGVFDLSGNVSEWVNAAPADAPDRRLVKGGLVGQEAAGTRCSALGAERMGLQDGKLGFRCCK